VSKVLGICPTAVTKSVFRGEWFAKSQEVVLKEKIINSAAFMV